MKPPPFCEIPNLGLGPTWRSPACPRSCVTSSKICSAPVAPTGCPREISPPETLTGIRPPSEVWPLALSPVGLAWGGESEVLDLLELGRRRCVVHFRKAHVCRANACLLVGGHRRSCNGRRAGARLAGRTGGAGHTDSAVAAVCSLLGGYDDACGTVADW